MLILCCGVELIIRVLIGILKLSVFNCFSFLRVSSCVLGIE